MVTKPTRESCFLMNSIMSEGRERFLTILQLGSAYVEYPDYKGEGSVTQLKQSDNGTISFWCGRSRFWVMPDDEFEVQGSCVVIFRTTMQVEGRWLHSVWSPIEDRHEVGPIMHRHRSEW